VTTEELIARGRAALRSGDAVAARGAFDPANVGQIMAAAQERSSERAVA
jgi:hypothetical protein